MIILAVESSCDETSVSIVKDGKEVLSLATASQILLHQPYGGVVPELAARNHIVHMINCFEKAISDANIKTEDIDYVAVTEGPGLIGSLFTGINAAVSFAYANDIKIIGVNHVQAHIYGAIADNDFEFPLLALVVSGGHTDLVYLKSHEDIILLGSTLDDAVGESYDKVSKMLGLTYPGGPVLDTLSKNGKDTYNFPRINIKESLDFSFSGLKSAVLNLINQKNMKKETLDIENIAHSFQNAVVDSLITKLKQAHQEYPTKQLVIAGGVAANSELRKRVMTEFHNTEILIPPIKYCTDQAAMIGLRAYYIKEYAKYNLVIDAKPNLSVDNQDY